MPSAFPNLLRQSALIRAAFALVLIAALWGAIYWAVSLP
jgi:hypothetical protein